MTRWPLSCPSYRMSRAARCALFEALLFSNFAVAISVGSHPFPSRTRKLSPPEPMVLHRKRCGRVGRRRIFFEKPAQPAGFSFFCGTLPGFPRLDEGANRMARVMVGVIGGTGLGEA